MFLLVLFPARLHEEGVRGHLAPRLVGVSFTHGDRRRLPSGERGGGWTLAGLGFPPKYAPAPSREEGGRRQAPPPARPGRPPPRTRLLPAPAGTAAAGRLTRDHHAAPEGPRRLHPPPARPPPGLRKATPRAPSKPFSWQKCFPGFHVAGPTQRAVASRPTFKKRLKPGLAERPALPPAPAARPPRPLALTRPQPRFRSPGRTPGATVPNPARRL